MDSNAFRRGRYILATLKSSWVGSDRARLKSTYVDGAKRHDQCRRGSLSCSSIDRYDEYIFHLNQVHATRACGTLK